MKLDNNMKRLLREMGEAINDSLSASDDLSLVIDRIRREGYDIFLILEATIGLNPRAADDGEETSRTLPASTSDLSEGTPDDASAIPRDDGEGNVVFQVSPDDEQFLRSLRISIDDSGAEPEADSDEGGDEEE